MPAPQRSMLEVTVSLLKLVPEEARLLAMQNLCQNNGGRWDYSADLDAIPDRCLYEIQLWGVPAMAETKDGLTRNWIRAAENILEAWDAGETPEETTESGVLV